MLVARVFSDSIRVDRALRWGRAAGYTSASLTNEPVSSDHFARRCSGKMRARVIPRELDKNWLVSRKESTTYCSKQPPCVIHSRFLLAFPDWPLLRACKHSYRRARAGRPRAFSEEGLAHGRTFYTRPTGHNGTSLVQRRQPQPSTLCG